MNNKILAIIFSIALAILFGRSVQAVSIFQKIDDNSSAQNLSILAIDTGPEIINAIEGKIFFDMAVQNCSAESGAKSIINIWLEKPSVKAGVINFSGIIPGGFSGSGELLSIACHEISGKEIKQLSLAKNDFLIYLNDGAGTLADVSISDDLQISAEESLAIIDEIANDKTAPEITALEILKKSALFDDKYLLIFNAVDKQSAVASIAVASSKNNLDTDKDAELITNSLAWTNIESPYALPDESLNRYIYFKVTDSAGNLKLAKLAPVKSGWQMSQSLLLFSLILISALVVLLAIVLKLKRRNRL